MAIEIEGAAMVNSIGKGGPWEGFDTTEVPMKTGEDNAHPRYSRR